MEGVAITCAACGGEIIGSEPTMMMTPEWTDEKTGETMFGAPAMIHVRCKQRFLDDPPQALLPMDE